LKSYVEETLTQKSSETIALVGATGTIGKSVAAALRQQGRRYRVIGRSRSALERTFGDDRLAEVATWDPDNGVLAETEREKGKKALLALASERRAA
jgi:nucleoside-diphosphate-sugar epimerase